jgi:hypothetical protein
MQDMANAPETEVAEGAMQAESGISGNPDTTRQDSPQGNPQSDCESDISGNQTIAEQGQYDGAIEPQAMPPGMTGPQGIPPGMTGPQAIPPGMTGPQAMPPGMTGPQGMPPGMTVQPSSHSTGHETGSKGCGCSGHSGAGAPHVEHDEHQYGQLMGIVNDIANGNADPSRIMAFLQNLDAQFWKGALVGVAATFLLTSDTVKNTIAGALSGVAGTDAKESSTKS